MFTLFFFICITYILYIYVDNRCLSYLIDSSPLLCEEYNNISYILNDNINIFNITFDKDDIDILYINKDNIEIICNYEKKI